MDKFVKDKLDTARMQPLPSTWGKIESQLDKDRKSVFFLQRSVIVLIGFLIIGITIYATANLWKSTSDVESSFVELESKIKVPHVEKLETENSDNLKELGHITERVRSINSELPLTKITRHGNSKPTVSAPDGFRFTSDNMPPTDPNPYQEIQTTRNSNLISAVPKLLKSLCTEYDMPYTRVEIEQDQDDFMMPADSLILMSKKRRFSIQQTVGVTSSFYTNSLSDYKYLNDSRGIGMDLQILAGYDLSNKWSIQSGIRYTKYSWSSNVGEPIDTNSAAITSGGTGYKRYAQGNEVRIDNYLKYVCVPLYVNYRLLNRNAFDINVALGISGDMLVDANVTEFIPDASAYVNVLEDSESTQTFRAGSSSSGNANVENVLEKYSWSYYMNIPVVYKFERFQFSAAPFGVWQGKNFMSTSASQRKANGYGIKLGLTVKL
jgi:hypothetical protein